METVQSTPVQKTNKSVYFWYIQNFGLADGATTGGFVHLTSEEVANICKLAL